MSLPSSRERFSTVPGYTGVVSCSSFSNFGLGVTTAHDILCCIVCDPKDLITLKVSTCAVHVRKHFPSKTIYERDILALCARYNVYHGELPNLPPPSHPAKPFIFLRIVKAFRCDLCLEEGKKYFAVAEKTRKNHFSKVHKNVQGGRIESQVDVQSFCSTYNDKHYFEVSKDLAKVPETDEYSLLEASPHDLLESYIENWSPALPVPTLGESLKDTQPFLFFTNWASHTSGHDPKFLCSLVEMPSNSSPLKRIVDLALREFLLDQSTLSATPESFRWSIMDEGKGNPDHAFRPLLKKTAEGYGRAFGLFFVFVMRLYQMKLDGDNRYPLSMTTQQESCLKAAWSYCRKEQGRPKGYKLIFDLSSAFWRPPSMDSFKHLINDQFDDATVRYAVLTNFHPDGTFSAPRNVSHDLVRVKYFIRAGLYMWARCESELNDHPINWIPEVLAPALTCRSVSPFSSVCSFVSHATLYANTSVHAPNVVWTGDHKVTVGGNPVDFRDFRRAFGELLLETERFISEDVLLGISPEKADFKIGPNTEIFDDHARTVPGYSFFSDHRNPFHDMRFSLMREFASSPAASWLFRGLDSDKNIVWSEEGVARWLNRVDKANRMLSLLMHMSGGQPARGTEMCLLKISNLHHRVRNVYWMGPGRLVYLMFYNKSTSNTSHDRVVAHAVPWRIGRLFLLLHGLISPLASVLIGRRNGNAARFILQGSVFSAQGKEMESEELSTEVRNWCLKAVGAPFRLTPLRHFIIACQRQYMPEAFSPMRRALAIVDAQAGHTSDTAAQHYAVNADETHYLAQNSVLKYILASARWWKIILPNNLLLPSEILDGNTAATRLAEPDLMNSMARATTGLTAKEVALEVAKILAEGPLRHLSWPKNLISADSPAPTNNPNALPQAIDSSVVNAVPSTSTVQLQLSPPEGPSISSEFGIASPLDAPLTRSNSDSVALSNRKDHFDLYSEWDSAPPPDITVDPRHVAVLNKYTGIPHSSWTCRGQGIALALALRRHASLLAIIPTGSGKSIIFGAAPLAESGITVVVFPLRALMQDQVESHCAKGINMQAWTPGFESVLPCVVAVSVETVARNESFKAWLVKQQKSGSLNRIVIDEAHLLCTSADFRPDMLAMSYILTAGVPIAALTATLPPSLERMLHRALGSPSWSIVREPTQRPNLVFRTAEYSNERQALASLKMHVQRYEAELAPGEGILIQCRTHQDVISVSKALGATAYTSKMEDSIRDKNARDWVTGVTQIIVGTSALGTGVHHPACRAIIHFNLPYTMADYGQESGRAGRDGKPALAIIMCSGSRPFSKQKVDIGGYDELLDMLNSDRCIRLHMSRYLDGPHLQTTCAGSGFAPCGRCSKSIEHAATRNGPALMSPDEPGPSRSKLSATDWVEAHLPTHIQQTEGTNTIIPVIARSTIVAQSSRFEPDLPQNLPLMMEHNSHSNHADKRLKTVARSHLAGIPINNYVTSSSTQPTLSLLESAPPPLHNLGPGSTSSSTSVHSHATRSSPKKVKQNFSNAARHRSSTLAKPPHPVGPTVIADAERTNELFRLEREQNTRKDAVNAPYDVATLLRIKEHLANTCVYCILYDDPHKRHTLAACPKCPGTNWALDKFPVNGQLFTSARKSSDLPRNDTTCFICWWPKHHHHPSSQPRCEVKDSVAQFCWLAYHSPSWRDLIGERLCLGSKELKDSGMYMQWLTSVKRTVQCTVGGEPRPISYINAYRVLSLMIVDTLQLVDDVRTM